MFKRIIITRLHDRFIELVKTYMERHNLSQKELAKLVDLPASVLNNLLMKKRPLSGNYLFNFIYKGVIMTNEIKDDFVMNEREREFWDAADLCQRKRLLVKIVQLERKGENVEELIDEKLKLYENN